jgi:hypothetical protein
MIQRIVSPSESSSRFQYCHESVLAFLHWGPMRAKETGAHGGLRHAEDYRSSVLSTSFLLPPVRMIDHSLNFITSNLSCSSSKQEHFEAGPSVAFHQRRLILR